MQLGREGKLWSVEIMFNVPAKHETKTEYKRNMETSELMKFREALFKYGFSLPVKAGHWRLILPMDILQVDIFKQDAFVDDGFRMGYSDPDQNQSV